MCGYDNFQNLNQINCIFVMIKQYMLLVKGYVSNVCTCNMSYCTVLHMYISIKIYMCIRVWLENEYQIENPYPIEWTFSNEKTEYTYKKNQ